MSRNWFKESPSVKKRLMKKYEVMLEYIEKNQNTKDYLEITLNIRARLNYLSKLKSEKKKEQITLFKLHQGNNKRFTNPKSSLQYDLSFSALFGCNVQV